MQFAIIVLALHSLLPSFRGALPLPAFAELGLALFLLGGLLGVVEDVSLEALAGATEEAVEVEVDAVELHDRILGIEQGCAEVGGFCDDGDRLPI